MERNDIAKYPGIVSKNPYYFYQALTMRKSGLHTSLRTQPAPPMTVGSATHRGYCKENSRIRKTLAKFHRSSEEVYKACRTA